ncbi:YbaB/EbfC family DNA-binding protein [Mycolicibacterium sp.]|uniref:YbaB/EbfC family DNA-binding protein n=1 Tax=Mycolicibacterium sp. TaxID=2320850 RepID=UPI001A20DDBA|nr:YbaB/EbfC family DNA-binding protein [Mycolicibacterium sp.]MBJ7341916.1 YbaB/EbfC family DNA-binding protein [Mycolicibacterium sp.]
MNDAGEWSWDGDEAPADWDWPLDDAHPGAPQEDETKTMLFSVTNPPGTVSVTALADGRPVHVDLAPAVSNMSESQLSEEISVLAQLASQNARAAQHLLASTMLQRLGHDRASSRAYVEHELGLPSPETVLADKAHVFATRYADHDWSM